MPINRPAAVTLDARSLTPATKTSQILENFDKLQIGTALELTEETDPRALRNEMTQLRPGRFSWDARNLGGNRWTIRLERIDENADGESILNHVAAFTSAKAAQRALAQSIAKHVGPEGVHVSLVMIDGVIDLPRTREMLPDRADDFFLKPDDIAQSVFFLTQQPKSAWTFELDVRPFGEKW